MQDSTFSPWSSCGENKGKNSKKISKRISSSSVSQKPFGSNSANSLDTNRITSELSTNEDEIDFNDTAKYDKKKLQRRARKKTLNNVVNAKLAHLHSALEEKYWETFRCSDIIIRHDNEVRSHFCKHRHCSICNNIRTAQLIEKYLLTIQSWPHKYFLTLTVKNPPAGKLPDVLNNMHQAFTQIKDSERKAGRKLIGIRKLEITYNRHEDTYHPHFHVLIKDAASVQQVIIKWLKKFNPHIKGKTILQIKDSIDQKMKNMKNSKKYIAIQEPLETIRKTMIADPQFQHWKEADDNACIELFKYITKLTSNAVKDNLVIVSALDTIFQAIQGRRIFQSFGFVAHQEVSAPENEEAIENDIAPLIYNWDNQLHDWISFENGDVLSEYTPTEWDLRKLKYVK